jgi:predicted dinucleotide-binding enzyme
MKIGVLGTGMVGDTIGSKLIELGHPVMMGSRAANNEKQPPLFQSMAQEKPVQGHLVRLQHSGKSFSTA